MASTYLTRTTSTAGNGQKFTISTWLKKSGMNQTQEILNCYGGNTSDADVFHWGFQLQGGAADKESLSINLYDGSSHGGARILLTTRKFRDCNAWYHLVLAVDTTQATDTNRLKLYVNGVQETSFVYSYYPSQNYSYVFGLGTSKMFTIGAQTYNGGSNYSSYFNGEMSHFNYIDGTAYDASAFGSTNAVTGTWEINTSPSVTYGTNGFFILKDGNSVTDQSSNSNNFTVGGGTLTSTKDCPSNYFSTWNPLYYDTNNNQTIFENGNTKASTNTDETAHNTGVSTLAMPVGYGKFYAEIKCNYNTSNTMGVGVINAERATKVWYRNDNLMNENDATYVGRVIYSSTGASITGGGVEDQSYGNSYTDGDIIGIACDMENGAVYFSKNGTWQNSGDPTSGASKTGAVDMSAQSWYIGTSFWYFYCGKKNTNNRTYYSANFGNGTFGTSSVSSAGTSASTPGTFEYDCPSGYEPLSTKGLNI